MKLRNKQWFIDRVGKLVFKENHTCKCLICESIYENGEFILDEFEAVLTHCYALDCKWRYFDAAKQRDKYEKRVSKFKNNNK